MTPVVDERPDVLAHRRLRRADLVNEPTQVGAPAGALADDAEHAQPNRIGEQSDASCLGGSIHRGESQPCDRQSSGGMLWFCRKALPGSTSAFTRRSRSKVAGGYIARVTSSLRSGEKPP